jgi:hypothetical protein
MGMEGNRKMANIRLGSPTGRSTFCNMLDTQISCRETHFRFHSILGTNNGNESFDNKNFFDIQAKRRN